MKKFMDYTRSEWEKVLQPKLKRMFLISGIALAGFLMFYMIDYWVNSTAIIWITGICYIVSCFFALAVIASTIYWYMIRYAEYKKVK